MCRTFSSSLCVYRFRLCIVVLYQIYLLTDRFWLLYAQRQNSQFMTINHSKTILTITLCTKNVDNTLHKSFVTEYSWKICSRREDFDTFILVFSQFFYLVYTLDSDNILHMHIICAQQFVSSMSEQYVHIGWGLINPVTFTHHHPKKIHTINCHSRWHTRISILVANLTCQT
jgi:hypothetical protein